MESLFCVVKQPDVAPLGLKHLQNIADIPGIIYCKYNIYKSKTVSSIITITASTSIAATSYAYAAQTPIANASLLQHRRRVYLLMTLS